MVGGVRYENMSEEQRRLYGFIPLTKKEIKLLLLPTTEIKNASDAQKLH